MSKNRFLDLLDTAFWLACNIIVWACIGVMLALGA